NITEQEIATPRIGDTAPTAGDNLIEGYVSGADITAGVAAGNYLQVYDVDMEEGARIAAFYQVGLTEEDIKEEDKADEDLREDLGKAEQVEAFGNRRADTELMVTLGHAYLDENGNIKFTGTNTVTKITPETAALNGGWYIAEGNINRNGTITVNGNVHLILAENSSLSVKGLYQIAGINVKENNSLTIYSQSKGDKMGSLNVIGGYTSAGIGGGNAQNCGKIVINGGRIEATGGYMGAGIGGGSGEVFAGKGGNVIINNGIVTATSGERGGAGIGGGCCGHGEEVTINGGTVTAISYDGGAGIGGGVYGNGGNVRIGGGTVLASADSLNGGAGIGGGSSGAGGNITLSGGAITATGGYGGAGIGSGYMGNSGAIIIENYPTVIATGGRGAADMGNGSGSTGTTPVKRGSAGGTDLTYTRLEVQNLSPGVTHYISFSGAEHKINRSGLTGFITERSKESKNIYLQPMGALISIDPGDVQNTRITIDANDYAKLIAGFHNGLDFRANSQGMISVPFNNETKISGDADFTISMWIFPKENEPYQTLFRQEGDTAGRLGLDFRFIKHNNDEGYLYFGFNKLNEGWQNAFPWNDEASLTNISKIPMHRWTHVALTKSGKSVILYANGTKYYEMTLDDVRYNALAPLRGDISFGGTPFVDQFFGGQMDEIQFWNTALTADAIKAWMYRETDNKHPEFNNLVYYYKLNQKRGSTVIDSKGSHDGTMINMSEANYAASNIRDWVMEAGSILKGELIGSYAGGSSKNGIDWNLRFEIVEQGKKGTATITQNNKFEYRAIDMNQAGNDTFTYKVKDPNGYYSNIQTVYIAIIPAPINYTDENGEVKSIGFNNVTKITQETATLNNGWYIVEGNINRSGTITVNGNVYLILADDSSLTVSGSFDAGINVSEGNSLTIFAQSEGDEMGTLRATGHFYAAGIGGSKGNCGNITINGGTVIATNNSFGSAGIGGGAKGSGGVITINGGKVTATGSARGAGIGGGDDSDGGNITLSGGIITATGGVGGAGIGSGLSGKGCTVIIKNHPTVIATGGEGAEDIGNGVSATGAPIIRYNSINGVDLTYVRLEVQKLTPDNTHYISFEGEEHEINSGGLTGFFAERAKESKDITVQPDKTLINIYYGDVQSKRIILNIRDYADPVAGFESALDFPANAQARLDIPFNSNTIVSGHTDFSIAMWIYPNENEPYQTLYRQYNTGVGTSGIWLRYIKLDDNEGYLYFGLDARSSLGGWQWVWDWNNGIPPSNTTMIPMNRWTHVALTKSGKKIILYANGIKYNEMILDNVRYQSAVPYEGNISIGGTSVDDQFFSGRMDEIQFWNTSLTPDEIKAWMFREIDKKHPKYNNLVLYYGLNEKSGSTIIDSKGSNNGTMVNMTDLNYIASDVKDWTVEAGAVLIGELVGSHVKGASNDGNDWNLIFEIVEQAKKGTATITGDNQFEYCTHDMNQAGHDSFTYRVKGPDGKYSNTQVVNIDVIPIPSAGNGNSLGSPSNSKSTNNANGKSETVATATTTQEGDKTITTIVVDDKKVGERLEQEGNNAVVTIPVMSGADVVIGTLNGHTVKNMESKDAVLEIKTSRATYTLPVSQINIDAVSGQFGKQVELKDITVSIKISEPAADTVKIVEDTANKNNYQIIVKPIEFEITCSSGSKTMEVSRFNAYVERMIAIPEGVDPSKITTGVILNSDGTFSHVPTAIIMIDGKYYAKINSLTNSTYSVIYSPKTFKDVGKHWAEKDINDIASRLVVSGVGDDKFEPDRDITRAEFSAIVVRALGLMSPGSSKDAFIDVMKKTWYYDAVSIAYEYGIISGYENGKFGPDDKITREQAMIMIARAMKITRLKVGLADGEADKLLTSFTDANSAAEYAKANIASCVKAGIVSGRSGKLIAPKDNITRAEAAVIVQRLLQNSNLI
ncbi:MAG: hypothetical protein GX808_13420, partial [Syntrophomonadaceae bacterium]|nr:hypothetical protein [Syntrophomonadaceae bacterium]